MTVVSVHNGKVENYREIRKTLGSAHVFESEKFELVDSEVIPHFFEETLSEKEEVTEALYSFFCALQGSGAIAIAAAGRRRLVPSLASQGKNKRVDRVGKRHERGHLLYQKRGLNRRAWQPTLQRQIQGESFNRVSGRSRACTFVSALINMKKRV